MSKQPNTSNDCECDCHIQIGGSGKPCPSCKAEFKQGYAKALQKIKEMIKARYNGLEILEYISKEDLK